MKICCVCKIEKELSLFSNNKHKKDGKSLVCKECHSEYRRKKYVLNKEKELKQVKEYQANNLEKYKSYNKKAGRVEESICPVCSKIVFLTKKEKKDNYIRYCSSECRCKNNNSDYHNYLRQVQIRALKTNKEFDIDKYFLKTLLEEKQHNKCAITGIDIRIYNLEEKKSLFNTASLDRIDSSKGYTKDNVQWVCLGINYMKLNFEEKELHKMLKLIKENYTGVV